MEVVRLDYCENCDTKETDKIIQSIFKVFFHIGPSRMLNEQSDFRLIKKQQ